MVDVPETRQRFIDRAHRSLKIWKDDVFRDVPRPSDVKLEPKDLELWTLRDLQTALVIWQHLQAKTLDFTDLEKYLNWYHVMIERRAARDSLASLQGHMLTRTDIKHRRAQAKQSPAQQRKHQRRQEGSTDANT